MTQAYKRPPITEAVIELRFAKTLEKEVLKKVVGRLEGAYPLLEEENLYQIDFNGTSGKMGVSHFGFKASSLDQTDILQMRPNQIGLSRRAPYLGWDRFESAFFEALDALKRSFSPVAGTRLGMRYISRIDIPVDEDNSVQYMPGYYVNMLPNIPEVFPAPTAVQASHVVTRMSDIGLDVTVNLSTMDSPLVGHASIQLDIDVARAGEIPQRIEELRALLALMRNTKNNIFESLVTHKARELFNQ